jgi:hypothetical protein
MCSKENMDRIQHQPLILGAEIATDNLLLFTEIPIIVMKKSKLFITLVTINSGRTLIGVTEE